MTTVLMAPRKTHVQRLAPTNDGARPRLEAKAAAPRAGEPQPAVTVEEEAAFLEQLIGLASEGDTTAVIRQLRAWKVAHPKNGGPPRNRRREESRIASGPPVDRRDLILADLRINGEPLDDVTCSSVERALFAAGAVHDGEILHAGDLCRWSAADLRDMGVDAAAVGQLRRALGKLELPLRGEG